MRDLCCRSRCSNQLCAIRPCSERRGQSAVAQAEDRKKNGHNGSRTGYDDAGHDAHLPVGVALGHAIGPAPDFYDPQMKPNMNTTPRAVCTEVLRDDVACASGKRGKALASLVTATKAMSRVARMRRFLVFIGSISASMNADFF